MPNKPSKYLEKRSGDRLLLLVAAIAQSPGIASSREAKDKGVKPENILIEAMEAIALDRGIEFTPCSVPTLRKDIQTLKAYGILPNKKITQGYRFNKIDPVPLPPKKASTKGWLTPEEILELRSQGWTLQSIGNKAGLTKERIRQILEEQAETVV